VPVEVLGRDGRTKDRQGIPPGAVLVSVGKGADQSIAAGWNKVQLPFKEWDPFAAFDNVTNYRFQPKVAGYYRCTAGVWVGGGTGSVLSLFKNGNEVKDLARWGGNGQAVGTGTVYLNGTTDYVEVWINVGAATSITGATNSTMQGFFEAVLEAVTVGVMPEPWHYIGAAGEPAFQNGWGNYGSGWANLAYRKRPDGYVVMKGMIALGTMSSPFVTLPVGYRPSDGGRHMVVATGGGPGQAHVYNNGTIDIFSGTNAWVDVSSLIFSTE
jgi:hypothetical protein